jgi:adenosylcobinamide-GDP ribazoletransferase
MTVPVTGSAVAPRSRRFLPPPIRGLRAAFVFLTRIPVGGFPYRSDDWKWAAAHAPVVGVVVGGLTGVVDRLLSPAGETAAAALAIGFSMLLTGAFHEDGLADTSDALGGSHDQAKVLTILKDSRIGTFGGAALVVSIVARTCLVAGLGERALVGLVVAGSLARAAPVWLVATLPYVTHADAAKSGDVLRGGIVQAVVATCWVAVLLAALIAASRITIAASAALLVSAALVAVVTGWRYRRRVGGITGDFLGATEQVAEIAALVALSYGARIV